MRGAEKRGERGNGGRARNGGAGKSGVVGCGGWWGKGCLVLRRGRAEVGGSSSVRRTKSLGRTGGGVAGFLGRSILEGSQKKGAPAKKRSGEFWGGAVIWGGRKKGEPADSGRGKK